LKIIEARSFNAKTLIDL